jgi:hypothetical protein
MVILDEYPIWFVYIATVVVVVIAAEIGFRVGMWLQRRSPDAKGTPMTGAVVGGMLGLMAFLLAFSISIVIGQHNSRKEMVVTEANAVGTAYLRADFLAEPDRTETRDLLREYVEVRLAVAEDLSLFDLGMERSEEIHAGLWAIVQDTVNQGDDSAVMALLIDSINEVIDVHLLRLTAFELRLPEVFGFMLMIATVLSFLLVGVASSSDGERDPLTILIFALAFAAALMVIVDLDRPQQGLLTVSQSALEDLLNQMTSSGP